MCSDLIAYGKLPYEIWGFNPSVGILCVQTITKTYRELGIDGFNPSVGILCVQTNPRRPGSSSTALFQSLGRDSVCSDAIERLLAVLSQ